jgi:hypothetical protein
MLPSIAGFNRAWLDRQFDQLAEFCDADIVMQLGRGRDKCVESYRQFISSAEVLEFEETNVRTDTWGDTAAITYDWTITYRQGGETKRDVGHELLVFTLRDGRWKVVLRVMLF